MIKNRVVMLALVLAWPVWAMETAVLQPERVEHWRVLDGTVEAVHQATLSAQTSGRVAEVLFDVNDYVEAGSVLVRFSNTEQKAALEQAEANLEAAEAAYRQAEAEYRRIRDVFEKKLVSKSDMDRATSQRDAARARLKAAESAVKSARQQYEYTIVRAPYAGIVTQRFIEPGESVNPGQPLMAGLSLDRLRVQVDVPQSMVAAIRAHRKASIWLDAEGSRILAGERVTIFPFADPASRTFRVRVDLPQAETGLFPGEFVKTAFVTETVERLLVPWSAVMVRSELVSVYVMDDAGRVSLRQIRLGNRHADRVEVLTGLQAGERLVLDPVQAAAEVLRQREAKP